MASTANPYDALLAPYMGSSGTDQGAQPAGPVVPGKTPETAPDPYAPMIRAATAPPDLPPGQMTGWQREVALPASSFARGVVSTVGMPGDIVRGVGAIGGAAAEQYLNPDPLSAIQNRNQLMITPNQGPQIVTPEMLSDAPGKPNVPAASWHNPIDTESLLGYPGISTIANPPSVQPQNLRERIEAGVASGAGAAVSGGAVTGGLSSLPAAARTIVQGAAAGGAGEVGGEIGEAVGGTPGRVIGTVVGGAGGARLAPGGGGPTALLPSTMDAETAALAKRAKELGIDVGVGAASNSPVIKYLDSVMRRLPFTGYGKYDEANQQAFAKAVTNTFGEDAPKVTPTVINNAYDRIGQVFNNAAGRYNVKFDPTIDQTLTNISRKVKEAAIDQGQKDGIQTQIDKIRQLATDNNGVIPGKAYVDLTKKGESLDILQGSRSTTSGQLGGQIRDAIDTALERSASPADVAALREARTQYKALKTVEPLTLRADAAGGVTPSTGEISPAALLGRVNQQYDNAARAQPGQIPLLDLGRIGQRFLKDAPSSGSSERLSLMEIGKTVGGLGMSAAGLHEAGVPAESLPYVLAAVPALRLGGAALRAPAIAPPEPLINSLFGVYPQLAPGMRPNQLAP